MTIVEPTYKQIAKEKVRLRNDNFFKQWLIPEDELPGQEVTDVLKWIDKTGKYLSPLEHDITNSDATTILNNIGQQIWTSTEVTSAFCHRASIAHQLTNCLSEVFFDKALKQAAQLDEYQNRTGKLIGPLHGLPISLKDNINISGEATTIGIVNYCFNPEKIDKDCSLVVLLRQLGAVFYVKTNVPVAMMMPETKNHIYGETLNPLNRSLSSGGSSGGEAALVKLKGSVIGIGSDIGGSIRIPASFQNLYGLKPSFGRFPTYGTRSGLPGLESVNSILGPMTNSIESLELICKAIVENNPWEYDAKVIPLAWNNNFKLNDKLNIAILIDDGYVRPTPPIRRGIEEVRSKLIEAGHEVIEWELELPPNSIHYKLSKLISKFFLSDGGSNVLQNVKTTGEPLFPYMEMYGNSPELSCSQLWQLQVERTKLINDYLQMWMQTNNKTSNNQIIDAIIMPATPFAGSPLGKFHDYVGYTSPFNLLDYSVGVFPVTRADKTVDNEDQPRETYYSNSDRKITNDYNAEQSHDGAVALQCVCRKLEEEKVIEIMKLLGKLVGYHD